MRQTAIASFYALFCFIAAPFAARAQDQVWTALTVKSGITKRWDVAASLEHRWRNNELDRFVDLRLKRDARKNWSWFYEYRAPLAQTVNLRHTLALEKTWKPRLHGVKLVEATGGVRYHFNRAASVRYGLYLQRSFGTLTPELSAEHWFETFVPTSDLRRTRYSVVLNWEASKRLRWSASWALQKDYTGLGVLEEDFSVLRLGLRCKL
ncbi:MAG: hypothetical protein NWQ75_03830 [Schleiferiaceae bacterium]|jgi:hypothetical protein|nr:hypothetical protein [Schleiferiaceae bacterium]MDP4728310.1 hypothetical protein [Schleiferiaceae bacterium]MDP4900913.1 hypothetical protein [Schleiferiaceae bacterium]